MSESGANEPRNIVRAARHEIAGRTSALVARGLADLDRLSKIAASRLSTELRDIHEAAYKGDVATVRAILSASPNQINARDKDKNTPLHCAAENGHVGVVEVLLDYGAAIDAKGRNGNTPLHCYLDGYLLLDEPGGSRVVEVLLAHGAGPNVGNSNGETPLHFSSGLWDVGGIDALEVLLAHGADPNARDSNGKTPLWGNFTKKVVEILLAHGADPNARDLNGRTPLHPAAGLGKFDVVRLLVGCGAVLEARNSMEETPLHRAVNHGWEQIADYLITVGANVNSKDRLGRTALDFAEALDTVTKRRCPNLISILHKHGARSGKA